MEQFFADGALHNAAAGGRHSSDQSVGFRKAGKPAWYRSSVECVVRSGHRSGETDSSGFHTCAHDCRHFVDFFSRGLALLGVVAHDVETHRRVTDE